MAVVDVNIRRQRAHHEIEERRRVEDAAQIGIAIRMPTTREGLRACSRGIVTQPHDRMRVDQHTEMFLVKRGKDDVALLIELAHLETDFESVVRTIAICRFIPN